MIGELINKFDNMEDNSFKAFKSLFKTSLDYPSDSIVTIGKVLTSDSRELIIGTERLRYHLLPIEKGTKKVEVIKKPVNVPKTRYKKKKTWVITDGIEGEELFRTTNRELFAEKMNRVYKEAYRFKYKKEDNLIYVRIPDITLKRS